MVKHTKGLLSNSRFWVLSSGLIASVVILGLVQQNVHSGLAQAIRLEEVYGFISMLLLFVALMATPTAKIFPNILYKDLYLHSRRALGVLAFYYGTLHAAITFFKQLNGFDGLKYLNQRYSLSLLMAVGALFIMFLMAVTSTDWAVRTLTFKNWKRLHRLIYLASALIVFHVWLIGTHYIHHTIYYTLTVVAIIALVGSESARILLRNKRKTDKEIS